MSAFQFLVCAKLILWYRISGTVGVYRCTGTISDQNWSSDSRLVLFAVQQVDQSLKRRLRIALKQGRPADILVQSITMTQFRGVSRIFQRWFPSEFYTTLNVLLEQFKLQLTPLLEYLDQIHMSNECKSPIAQLPCPVPIYSACIFTANLRQSVVPCSYLNFWGFRNPS